MVDAIKPGLVKYKPTKMPFVQMENINAFLSGIAKLGVPAHESFMTVDLFEKKNPGQGGAPHLNSPFFGR